MSHVLRALLIAVLFTGAVWARQSQAPQLLNWSADDAKRIAALRDHGQRTEGRLAVLWTPAGVLNESDSAQLVARLDKGLGELRSVIGTYPWQFVKDQKIVFYVSDDQFVAHANGDETVMIPLVRLKDGRAPFLHEAAHALTSRGPQQAQPSSPQAGERMRASRPQWLIEGIADYLSQTAAKKAGVVEGDVFDVGGIDLVDETCATRLHTPAGQEIAPLIGALGAHLGLFTTERAKYAPAFYACAFSYTKYLAGLIGNAELIGLMNLQSRVTRATDPIAITPDGVLPRIQALTGKPSATVRAEWLQSLGSK